MPTAEGESLSDDDNDDQGETKCWCSICGTEIGLIDALRCERCGCMFCSVDCARQYPYCDAELHRASNLN
jgi:hypothetical protein